jgi:dTDP-4-amino-4,6-dideoxygalactose transaminase
MKKYVASPTDAGIVVFNRAEIQSTDVAFMLRALERGHISGNGPATREAESLLSRLHDGAQSLLTTSCTHSLELTAILGHPEPGDEVIVPAFTFVSTAAAFLLHGWKPVFADVRHDTLNLDVDAVETAITPRTRAVCTVHYAGVGAEPDRLAALCERRGLLLIEDNAHGLGGRWNGRTLGTFGALSTLSFHETKNVTCGEGGALIVNDSGLVERAEILREKGTNRARFFRGQVDKYSWVDVGSSWVMSDLLAEILVGQLSRLEAIQARRHTIWSNYARALDPWALDRGVRLPIIPRESEHTAHMFHLRLPSLDDRTRFIQHLADARISAVFHYQPLHLSDVGRRLGGRPGQFPVTEDAGDTLVRLPMFVGLTDEDQARVIDRVLGFRPA